MKTLLKFGIPGLLVLLVPLYFIGSAVLNKTVKFGIETIAPEVLGVSVNIESISISPFSGNGIIKGITVDNPDGYSDVKAFYSQEIYLNLSIPSLLSSVIHIEELRIIQCEFNYEKKFLRSNISQLLKTLEGGNDDDPSGESTVKFQIDELLIEDGSIRVGTLGAGLTLPLPTIHLQGIGKEGGVTPREALGEILTVVLSNIVSAAGAESKKVLESGEDAVRGMVDRIKGLF